jgi:hypothetical protein
MRRPSTESIVQRHLRPEVAFVGRGLTAAPSVCFHYSFPFLADRGLHCGISAAAGFSPVGITMAPRTADRSFRKLDMLDLLVIHGLRFLLRHHSGTQRWLRSNVRFKRELRGNMTFLDIVLPEKSYD